MPRALSQTGAVPESRIRLANPAPVRPDGDWVVYWMIASRRTGWNYGLQRAVEKAVELNRPLLILEALRVGYPFASDRLHRFVIDGMADNRKALADRPVLYHPYVEPAAGAGKGLLEALAARACLVVTDDFPCFFVPRMVAAAAARLPVSLEAVDSNGLWPVGATARVFPTARGFRSWLAKYLGPHLRSLPAPDPLRGARLPQLEALPREILRRWPAVSEALLSGDPRALLALPVDHSVAPVQRRGGSQAAQRQLRNFLAAGLDRYQEERNDPDSEATSGLSPYLHFGHLSSHQAVHEVLVSEGKRLEPPAKGTFSSQRHAFWGLSEGAESFLDELVTWRELGLNLCAHRPDYAEYDSLPAWALRTLEEHQGDPRPHLYSPEQLERAQTGDPLWNATQRQLVQEGRVHSYLRMLWGKKILEWSATPRQALEVMEHLNNKYALDGRDPNSYSGIFWVLGRYDRPWGPKRPIFGSVRYMSSANTLRKLEAKEYLRRYAGDGGNPGLPF